MKDCVFMGHNIRFASLHEILKRNQSEYLEYPCLKSKSISRLAINYKKKIVVVQYHSSSNVYSYKKVKSELIQRILQGESKGKTVSMIKAECYCKKRDYFPVTFFYGL